ncbi:MAG TPA: hypothetical protein VN253_21405, partial [Kofleriaceae bacterium]|nr:hypothetical protein [Kofleriaceae bacterium]
DVPPLAKPVVSSRRTISKLTLAGGGTMLAAGAVLGFVAHRRYDAQFNASNTGPCKEQLSGPPICSEDGFFAVEKARSLGNLGTIIGGVGIGALLAGGYLWFSAPSSPAAGPMERKLAVVPQLSPSGGGLTVLGRF